MKPTWQRKLPSNRDEKFDMGKVSWTAASTIQFADFLDKKACSAINWPILAWSSVVSRLCRSAVGHRQLLFPAVACLGETP
jgi:hypothetical protein